MRSWPPARSATPICECSLKKIIVWERKGEDKTTHLDLEIVLNAAFRIHFDEFENGELIDRGYALQAFSQDDFQAEFATRNLDDMPMYM